MSLLWKEQPREMWLPAYRVFGEGIYLELDESRLQQWERRPSVVARIEALAKSFESAQHSRRLPSRKLPPRFVLLHTFAHVLINQLTFDCGYTAAALHERLYVSDDQTSPMCGLLIYTADGDSEGTLGGLVRMGTEGRLDEVLGRALLEARWCSSDPICMEVGSRGGQGPDSCNLAACHRCALVPETTCEHQNRFLDRGMLIGDLKSRELGFFSEAVDPLLSY